MKPVLILLAIAFVAAILPLPYAYYQFLRIFATGCFLWLAYALYDDKQKGEGNGFKTLCLIVAGAFAILYNPLFPIYMMKEYWTVANLLSAGFIGILCYNINTANLIAGERSVK